MEFRFNVKDFFKTPIVKVNNNLLPINFKGDRRTALDVTSKVAEIINEMGELSAKAQGLNKPVTTANKLRNSDHMVYFLTEPVGKNGAITGLLKIGEKSLYVFDTNGETKMLNAPCVLDFYIHESRQRSGLGKELYENMLATENYKPEKMAIDRPSEKLLGFLKKHYNLNETIPQMNNFVVYNGFFENSVNKENGDHADNHIQMQLTSSPNTALFGPNFISDEYKRRIKTPVMHPAMMQSSPVGRYAARRPTCSMAEIIHNSPSPVHSEPNSKYSNDIPEATINNDENIINEDNNNYNDNDNNNNNGDIEIDVIEEYNINIENINKNKDLINNHNSTEDQVPELKSNIMNKNYYFSNSHLNDHNNDLNRRDSTLSLLSNQNPNFHYNKQHTGLKNISYNIGMIVSPTNDDDDNLSTIFNNQHNNHIITQNNINNINNINNNNNNNSNNDINNIDNQQINQNITQNHINNNNNHNNINHNNNNNIYNNNNHNNNNIQNDTKLLTKNLNNFHFTKQHTGLKNLSFNVGSAVTPSNKMEFDQETPESFGVVKLHHPYMKSQNKLSPRNSCASLNGLNDHNVGNNNINNGSIHGINGGHGSDLTDGASTISSDSEGRTEQGFLDLKFYHNKLW